MRRKKIELAAADYTFEAHLVGKPESIRELMHSIREYVTWLDSAIDEVSKKFYVAYKASQNIVCVEARKKSVRLWLKLGEIADLPATATYRNVSGISALEMLNSPYQMKCSLRKSSCISKEHTTDWEDDPAFNASEASFWAKFHLFVGYMAGNAGNVGELFPAQCLG
jgi:predicted transport protein